MNLKSLIRKAAALSMVWTVLLMAAGTHLPQVHAALHAHEEACSDEKDLGNDVLCSSQNHLAANLGSAFQPDLYAAPALEDKPNLYRSAPVSFIPRFISSRAPPVLPAR